MLRFLAIYDENYYNLTIGKHYNLSIITDNVKCLLAQSEVSGSKAI